MKHTRQIKVCIGCHKEYEGTKWQKWCSKQCKDHNRDAHSRVEYQREYRKVNGFKYTQHKPKIKKECPVCKKEFKGFKHNRFCSKDCSHKATLHPRIKLTDEEKRIRRNYLRRKRKDENVYEYRRKRQEYKKRRLSCDIDYKLKYRISNEIRQSINGNKKYNHAIDLLGCSIEEAKQHLERQFKYGMSWDNWGVDGWHIDHIIPIASFDFTKEEDQYRCFHYTNLQPLWADENIMKRDKIITKQLVLI